MKKGILFVSVWTVFFICLAILSPLLFGGQDRATTAQQLQQAKVLLARQDIIIADIKLDRNNAIAEVARLAGLLQDQRNGIIRSEKIIQKAIDNDTKIDYKELMLAGWDLVIPDKSGKKPKGKLP